MGGSDLFTGTLNLLILGIIEHRPLHGYAIGKGAALGLLLGVWGARGLTATMPETLLPAFVEVSTDATVFLVVTGLMTLVGLGVAGLVAARRDVAGALRAHGRGRVGGSRLQQLRVDPGHDFEALYGFTI